MVYVCSSSVLLMKMFSLFFLVVLLQALNVAPIVRPSCFAPKVDAIQYYGQRLAELNQKLRPKQEHKLEAAKVRVRERCLLWHRSYRS